MNTQILQTIISDHLAEITAKKALPIKRDFTLSSELKSKEITVVTGVRRCGKSSLLREFITNHEYKDEILYVNFDDPRLISFESEDFEKLYKIWLDNNAKPNIKIAIFDEIQNIEGWERWMNFFSDQKGFKVFISGSNSKLLSSELSSFLTGRHKDITLYPLSFNEILKHDLPELIKPRKTTEEKIIVNSLLKQYLHFGGFPRVWLGKDRSLLGEYYKDILLKDIVSRRKLRQSKLIADFGTMVMSDIGRKINKSKLSEAIGIKEVNTVNKYFGYFDECYLGFEIEKFDTSARKKMRNQTKFYSIDSALPTQVGLSNDSKIGFYFENAVLIELYRRKCEVYYWEKQKSSEIDFVVKAADQKMELIQVAWNLEDKKTIEREVSAFEDFVNEFTNINISKKTIITFEEYNGADLPEGITVITFADWALIQ